LYSRSQYGNDKKNISKIKTSEFKYPVRHSHTQKEGEIIYWSNTKESNGKDFIKMFDVPKVILIGGLYPYPLNDFEGKYATSNYSFGIPIRSKKEGDDIVKAINTEQFGDVLNSTKWFSGYTDHNMFKYFKPDFYKYFLKESKSSKKEPKIKETIKIKIKEPKTKKIKEIKAKGKTIKSKKTNKTRKLLSYLKFW
jgi:hypothetical protein